MAKTSKATAPARKKLERSTTDLTQTICERQKAGPKQICLWDAKLRGFCLRITPAVTEKRGRKEITKGGARSFWLKLSRTRKNSDGTKTVTPTWIRIGSFGAKTDSDLTVEVARKRAQKLKDIHEQGGDVRAIRQEQRNPDDVRQLVKEYKESRAYTKLRQSTRNALTSYCLLYTSDAADE